MKELSDQITLICSTYFRAITSQELLYRLPNLYNLQNYMKFLDKVVSEYSHAREEEKMR